MSDYVRRTQGRGGNSSGGGARNILIFIGGAIVILGVVVWFENSRMRELPSARHPEDFVDNTPVPAAGTSDNDYIARGLQPNRPTPTDCATRTRVGIAPARFVGVSEFKTYHRPDCKTLQYVDEKDRIPLASAADAFSKGFVPCKVCRPETPGAVVRNPSKPVRPLQPTDKPVSLPIKDVVVSFPFTVISRDAIVEKGVVRIEYEVEVQRPLAKSDVMLLAQKLVAQETAKGPINAVSLFVHTNPRSGAMIKWVGSADWAPYGILTRAGEVKAGDYSKHQFNSGPFQGFFNPKSR